MPSGKHCVIAGGETTVILGEKYGKGGRNQEFALAAASYLRGMKDVVLLSCGTDGIDGNSDAAGAIVDNTTYDRCLREGYEPSEYLKNHDSYSLLKQIGALIYTGPTLTNVMDIQIALIKK